MNRCLNLLDLTTLGVGSTLGLGLYVLAGQVASNKAGPAVVVSFALAALASAFSALCYAEFAGRVPRAGSAYAYSYITVGEFVAFIIGWNLILEYVIGASSVARGFSGYLRFVFDHVADQFRDDAHQASSLSPIEKNHFTPAPISSVSNSSSLLTETSASQHLVSGLVSARQVSTLVLAPDGAWYKPITDYVWQYFDWTSIAIVVVLTAIILFGVKESTNLTLAFTSVNMIVVIVVVISSVSSLDLHNWQLDKRELPKGTGGEGGFIPYGWSGVLAGSATCFFGFIGFDTIASSAEEAINPKRNVPLSIILSLFISFLAYMSIAVVQTLLWPYYAQNSITILPHIFAQLNMPLTYWIVLLGAIAGLASSQLGGMYPLPRILYSMAQDKLIYSSLAHINRRLKLPVRATILGSVFIAILACLLDIQELADMVSIGTLAAYSLVSLSVLVIRYEDRSEATQLSCAKSTEQFISHENKSKTEAYDLNGEVKNRVSFLNNQFDRTAATGIPKDKTKTAIVDLKPFIESSHESRAKSKVRRPTEATSKLSKFYILSILILTIALCLIIVSFTSSQDGLHDTKNSTSHQEEDVFQKFIIYSIVVIVAALVVFMYLLSSLPTGIEESQADMFMVPLVPLTPTLSILVNTFLMLNLGYLTWIRFALWMSVGLFIYFSYGIWNSQGYKAKSDDCSTVQEGNNQSKMLQQAH